MKWRSMIAAVLCLCTVFAFSGLPAAYAGDTGTQLSDGDVILDLNFDDGTVGNFFSYVNGGDMELLNTDGQLACHIRNTGTLDYANQAYLDGFSVVQGCGYRLSFDAWSDADCSLQYRIQLNGGDYHAYAASQAVMTPESVHYEMEFTMEEPTDPAPRLAFNMGMQEDMTEDPGEHTIYFDNILLEVTDAAGIVSEENEVGSSLLSVNHVGYRPQDPKMVIAEGTLAGSSFEIQDENGVSCFEGVFSDAMDDPASGLSVCRGDFSEFTSEGSWQIVVTQDNDVLASERFSVAENVYGDLTEQVLQMLTLQRCGCEVTDPEGIFSHPDCHTEQALVYGTSEYKDVTGGWHDAGDYGRYVVSGAKAVADLLYIYENINPAQKILDEIRYELEWMLKMQDEAGGGVYHKVTCAGFPGTVMPQEETDQLILSPVSDAATGDFAAVMAKAAIIYQESDADFADRCVKAAKAAWNYLKEEPSLTGFTNPGDIVTGEYPDTNLNDEQLWAAVELLALAQSGSADEALQEECAQTIQDSFSAGVSCELGWADIGGYALYDLAKAGALPEEIQECAQQAREQILSAAQQLKALSEADGFGVSMGTDYYWGSNMGVANHGMLFLMAQDLTGDDAWLVPAAWHLDYLLGMNGLDFCYVSGVGENCLQDPHHRPSQAMGKAMPGMLAGGPNPNLEDPYAQQVLSGRAPALCYADNQQSYSTNEVAVYWNSVLLVLLSAFGS